jgi:hypothetical protein
LKKARIERRAEIALPINKEVTTIAKDDFS